MPQGPRYHKSESQDHRKESKHLTRPKIPASFFDAQPHVPIVGVLLLLLVVVVMVVMVVMLPVVVVMLPVVVVDELHAEGSAPLPEKRKALEYWKVKESVL